MVKETVLESKLETSGNRAHDKLRHAIITDDHAMVKNLFEIHFGELIDTARDSMRLAIQHGHFQISSEIASIIQKHPE